MLTTTRTVTEAATYRFVWRAISGRPAAGEYDIKNSARREPHFRGPTDADGVTIPRADGFPVGLALTFAWDTSTLATTVEEATNLNPYNEDVGDLFLTLADRLNAFNTDVTMMLPAMERTVTTTDAVPVWAGRSVVSPRDQIAASNAAILSINLARYTVRYDSRIAALQTMIDEEGATRTILGVQPLGRREYLDLLAERIS